MNSKVTLNCEAVGNDSMDALPVPGHVILNHLYAQSVKQGVLVAGIFVENIFCMHDLSST